MAAILGKTKHYDSQTAECTEYVGRVQQFFVSSSGTGEDKIEKRRTTILTLIGPSTYKLLKSLVSLMKPHEKTIEQLVEVLMKHYSSKPVEIRYRFNAMNRLKKLTILPT